MADPTQLKGKSRSGLIGCFNHRSIQQTIPHSASITNWLKHSNVWCTFSTINLSTSSKSCLFQKSADKYHNSAGVGHVKERVQLSACTLESAAMKLPAHPQRLFYSQDVHERHAALQLFPLRICPGKCSQEKYSKMIRLHWHLHIRVVDSASSKQKDLTAVLHRAALNWF